MGTWGRKCQSLWTCSPRSLGLPSKLVNAFLFPLTNHSQIFKGPIVSFLITLAWVLQVQMLYSCASLLAISPGVTNLSCIRQIWVYVLFLRTETTNYSPLNFFPFVASASCYYPHTPMHTHFPHSLYVFGIAAQPSSLIVYEVRWCRAERLGWGCVSFLHAAAWLERRVT